MTNEAEGQRDDPAAVADALLLNIHKTRKEDIS